MECPGQQELSNARNIIDLDQNQNVKLLFFIPYSERFISSKVKRGPGNGSIEIQLLD